MTKLFVTDEELGVPAWVDISRLCHETCLSPNTVDAWIEQGLLPAGRMRGGKRMWKWKEVDAYLERGGPAVSVSPNRTPQDIANATRKILAESGR